MNSKKMALILTMTLLTTSATIPTYSNVKAATAKTSSYSSIAFQPTQLTLNTLEAETNQAIESRNFESHMNNLAAWLNANISDTSVEAIQAKLKDPVFACALAQWQLLYQTNLNAMDTFAETTEHQDFLKWLMKNATVMNTFLEGGAPVGDQPVKALEIWEKIWVKDPDSHEGLYLKLAMATGLSHARPITCWTTNTIIDPVERYEYFKASDKNNELFPSFRTSNVWDLRMVVDAKVTNEDLTWARKKICESRPDLLSQEHIGESCWMPQYTDKNPNGVSVFSGSDKFYGMPFSLAKVLEYGGVCGSLSTYGSSVTQAFGVPAQTIGQPGHCSFVRKKTPTQWVIEYDVGGWGVAETDQGRILWADNSIHNISPHEPTYLLLMQDALSKPVELSQSERMRWLGNAITSKDKAMEVRNAAIKVSPLNILIWRDQINSMKGNSNITNDQWQTLGRDIANTFPKHLAPMMDLIYSIRDPLIKSMDQAQLEEYSNELGKVIDATTDKIQLQIAPKVKKFKKSMGFIGTVDKELVPMTIASVTSQQDPATNAIDEDTSTIWHTKWDLSDKLPQSITVKLDNAYDIYKLDYVPRQDDCNNGIITSYNIYTSVDGVNFTKVANGRWNLDKNKKSVTFNTANARYVRLEALEGFGGYASAAEIMVYKKTLAEDNTGNNPTVNSEVYLSDLTWKSAKAGWGNSTKDKSICGSIITLDGKKYEKGIGTHANSEIVYEIGGKYSKFTSDIGVDDEIGDYGSLIFRVFGDGKLLYESGTLTGKDAAEKVDVDVSNVNELKLVVTDAGDGMSNDHADWANAKLSTLKESDQPQTNLISLVDKDWTKATVGWGTIQKNKSIDQNAITLNGEKYTTAIGTHSNSEIVYNLNGNYKTFKSTVGIDDEVPQGLGSVIFRVYGDGKLLFDSGVIKGHDKSQNISADITGVNELKLVVENAKDGNSWDHADWAEPIVIK